MNRKWFACWRTILVLIAYIVTACGVRAQTGSVVPLPFLVTADSLDDPNAGAEGSDVTEGATGGAVYRLSTSVSERWEADPAVWLPYVRTVYLYDAAGRTSAILNQVWNGPGWLTGARHSYAYDTDGRLVLSVSEGLEGSTLAPSSRSERTYDGEGRAIGFVTDTWQESLWVHSSRSIRMYSSDPSIDTTAYFTWSDTGWVAGKRAVTWRDEAGRVVLRLYQRTLGGGFFDDLKYLYAYDAYGARTLYQVYGTYGNDDWFLRRSVRDSLVYDAEGRLTEGYRGTKLDTPWVPETWRSYTYDAAGSRVGLLTRTLVPDAADSASFVWAVSNDESSIFDAAGNRTLRVGRVWQESVWVNSYRNTNEWEVFLLGIEQEPDVAGGFRLEGNYPNPFNPATTISYVLPRSLPVRLSVFDLLGRHVATLVDGVQEAGSHRERWDAAGAASGVYVYRLSAGSTTSTGKMLLLR